MGGESAEGEARARRLARGRWARARPACLDDPGVGPLGHGPRRVARQPSVPPRGEGGGGVSAALRLAFRVGNPVPNARREPRRMSPPQKSRQNGVSQPERGGRVIAKARGGGDGVRFSATRAEVKQLLTPVLKRLLHRDDSEYDALFEVEAPEREAVSSLREERVRQATESLIRVLEFNLTIALRASPSPCASWVSDWLTGARAASEELSACLTRGIREAEAQITARPAGVAGDRWRGEAELWRDACRDLREMALPAVTNLEFLAATAVRLKRRGGRPPGPATRLADGTLRVLRAYGVTERRESLALSILGLVAREVDGLPIDLRGPVKTAVRNGA